METKKCFKCGVSIHAPARGATTDPPKPVMGIMFQSTPLREGRRYRAHPVCYGACFNPRPCARGDRLKRLKYMSFTGFNPRPCARGDFQLQALHRVCPVSIHAPARGATAFQDILNAYIEFQSTPLREGRRNAGFTYQWVTAFQSTPLREGRHGKLFVGGNPIEFQSTPLREGRPRRSQS